MEDNFLIPIGKRIAEIRKSHGITQEALADQLGVTPKHISHTERGISSLSLKNLVAFCNLFDCSLDYIIFGKVEKQVLTKLPDGITSILYQGKERDINQLNRYLKMYLELIGEE